MQSARAARWAASGQRHGYLRFAFSIVVFISGLITDFSDTVSRIVTSGS